MRNRVLRKDIWQQPTFTALTHAERLIYLGLHNMADDAGRQLQCSQRIIETLVPFDPNLNVPAILEKLVKSGLVYRYAFESRIYLYLVGFERTQSTNKPQPSKLPAPEEGVEI